MAKKFNKNKPDWSILDLSDVEEIVKVLTHGAKKYGKHNYKGFSKEEGLDFYYAALMRHITAHRRGEKNDPETGLSHLAHAGCNILFLMHFEKINK